MAHGTWHAEQARTVVIRGTIMDAVVVSNVVLATRLTGTWIESKLVLTLPRTIQPSKTNVVPPEMAVKPLKPERIRPAPKVIVVEAVTVGVCTLDANVTVVRDGLALVNEVAPANRTPSITKVVTVAAIEIVPLTVFTAAAWTIDADVPVTVDIPRLRTPLVPPKLITPVHDVRASVVVPGPLKITPLSSSTVPAPVAVITRFVVEPLNRTTPPAAI